MILVTGGAGFIGSNFVLDWLKHSDEPVVNVDKLTYAGNRRNLASLDGDRRHVFVAGDIGDQALVERLLAEHRPRALINFAAESHVDRSIHGAGEFIQTNVVGTFKLLDAVRGHWQALARRREERVPLPARLDGRGLRLARSGRPRLQRDDALCAEQPLRGVQGRLGPSRAGVASHLRPPGAHDELLEQLRAVPVSREADPAHDPERHRRGSRFRSTATGETCGTGSTSAIIAARSASVLERGRPGEVYNIGGESEQENIAVVRTICELLDELLPRSAHRPHEQLISYVKDRPGHDRRYAIDCRKIRRELDWTPAVRFKDGLRQTVEWYLSNQEWVKGVQSGAYREWIEANYAARA